MAEVPDPSTLSATQQLIAYAGYFTAALLAALLGWKKKSPSTPNDHPQDVVLAGASITDMRPVRDMSADLRRIADASERMVKLLESEAAQEQIDKRIRDEAEKMFERMRKEKIQRMSRRLPHSPRQYGGDQNDRG